MPRSLRLIAAEFLDNTLGRIRLDPLVLVTRSDVYRHLEVTSGRKTQEGGQGAEEIKELPPFEESLVAHLDGMFGFALRLANGRRSEAEDLVQEACLRAFRGYENLRSPGRIKAWFFRILVNIHINEFHHHSREVPTVDVELSDSLLESADVVAALTPEDFLLEGLLDADVQRALDALPVEFRAVVWLSDVEELSYKEIAEIVDCPLGTVASRLYRGHSLLRHQLLEYARRRRFVKE
jgi:RNA polymerase sigma-70 factor (ECF subfamily)